MFPIGAADNRDACNRLIDAYDLKYLILTAGADYSMVFSADTISFLETPKVDVGYSRAGDSFTGIYHLFVDRGVGKGAPFSSGSCCRRMYRCRSLDKDVTKS